MKFELFSEVILNVDVPEDGLKQGDVGTVVEHHETPSGEKGYSVEFVDLLGNTLAVVTLDESAFRSPIRGEHLAVRKYPQQEQFALAR